MKIKRGNLLHRRLEWGLWKLADEVRAGSDVGEGIGVGVEFEGVREGVDEVEGDGFRAMLCQ